MGYPYSWEANKDLEIKSGTAKFMVDGEGHEFKLESFGDCMRIADLLDTAHKMGREFGAGAILDAVKTAGERRHSELTL